MPRSARLDFKDAIQYVTVFGRKGSLLFLSGAPKEALLRSHFPAPKNCELFLQLLSETCEETGLLVHGYCIGPNSAVLVVQTADVALSWVMRRLLGKLSSALHKSGDIAEGQKAFERRYASKVVAPEYLPHAVRRAHCAPVKSGVCKHRLEYRFSSEHAYLAKESSSFLTTEKVRDALELRGRVGLHGYCAFMEQSGSDYVEKLFREGSPLDSRIVGSKLYVRQVRQNQLLSFSRPTQQQLIGSVASLLGVRSQELFDRSRTGVLGRALVAWYATRAGTITLTETGRWFSCTGAALRRAIVHYRACRPELFTRQSILPEMNIGDDRLGTVHQGAAKCDVALRIPAMMTAASARR